MINNSVLPINVSGQVVFDNNNIVGVVGRRQGYVGVPRGHPWDGVITVDSEECKSLPFPDVHGGVTWSNNIPSSIPASHSNKDLYWIGWDYCHYCGSSSSSSDMMLGISYGVTPTYNMLRDEVLRVCNAANRKN